MAVEDRLKISSERLSLAGERRHPVARVGPFDAPELAAGVISPAADVWSLGVTIIQALTRRAPRWESVEGRDPIVPESIPEPFAEIARGCLRCDPAQRFSLGDVKVRLGFPDADSARRAKSANRGARKRLVTLAAAAALAAIAVLAALQLRSHMAPATPAGAAQKFSQPTTSFLHHPGLKLQSLEKQKPLRNHALKTPLRCRRAQRKSPPPEPLWAHPNRSRRNHRQRQRKLRARKPKAHPRQRRVQDRPLAKGRSSSPCFARPASQRYSKHSSPRRRQNSRRRGCREAARSPAQPTTRPEPAAASPKQPCRPPSNGSSNLRASTVKPSPAFGFLRSSLPRPE